MAKKTAGAVKALVQSKTDKALQYILLIGGIIGVFCAGILTVEKINLLKHPANPLNCDLSPIVACGPVINTDQASAFGFPNPLIGLVGFAVMATIGGGLLAGASFKRWFWIGQQIGITFAVCFTTWLQYQSIFNIGTMCPFCIVVWTITIPMFIYSTVHNLKHGHIKLPARLSGLSLFIQKHHADILFGWYAILIAVILQHFWYYWSTLL